MRSIVKGAEPRALIQWKADNAQTPENLVYGRGGFPGEAVRAALLAEQFHLCAYIMMRLKTAAECRAQGRDTTDACHIEHLLPQARKVPGEDIDYRNMVACYPPSSSKVACDFGARAKGDFDPAAGSFVSPVSPGAERHFEFDEYGGVTGRTPAGAETIRVLRLDHPALVNDRAAVIRGALRPRGRPLSAAAARRLATEITHPNQEGCLPAYCVAVASAALALAARAERRAARLRKQDSTR
ncbi:hypothetical protein [uncultured Thiocystis sp.]|jgi:hypothetical protein|uniref:hypothetical protein n=1 Tax=uncultured Thiocystis sp. TaxID=1202134 RepID=UPI0025EDE113|nr:hypothetical protein [uncultured Thiocystis sp.]